MTRIYTLEKIKQVVKTLNFSTIIEEGFVSYSNGQVVVPPVGELVFEDPPGIHILSMDTSREMIVLSSKLRLGFIKI